MLLVVLQLQESFYFIINEVAGIPNFSRSSFDLNSKDATISHFSPAYSLLLQRSVELVRPRNVIKGKEKKKLLIRMMMRHL